MGCASSKTSSWVVTYGVGGGECKSITQISLSTNATLKEVRHEIDLHVDAMTECKEFQQISD